MRLPLLPPFLLLRLFVLVLSALLPPPPLLYKYLLQLPPPLPPLAVPRRPALRSAHTTAPASAIAPCFTTPEVLTLTLELIESSPRLQLALVPSLEYSGAVHDSDTREHERCSPAQRGVARRQLMQPLGVLRVGLWWWWCYRWWRWWRWWCCCGDGGGGGSGGAAVRWTEQTMSPRGAQPFHLTTYSPKPTAQTVRKVAVLLPNTLR